MIGAKGLATEERAMVDLCSKRNRNNGDLQEDDASPVRSSLGPTNTPYEDSVL
jgi:hypothetical protein